MSQPEIDTEVVPNPVQGIADLIRHRYLIGQLTRREVLLKYRGSYLGIVWSFFHPLLLLIVFTYVFGDVFGARWPTFSDSNVPFALVMYSGLIVFNMFAEVASAAPRLLHGYQSYVKKIIFPVEILPLVLVMTALIHGAINLLVLTAAIVLLSDFHPTLLLAPVILAPLMLFAAGIGWFLAAMGVFIRDLIHVMPVLVQMMMFLSPVFYPVSAVPENLRWIYQINPLSGVIEQFRRVTLWGEMPVWGEWGLTLMLSMLTVIIGYAFFRQSREEFADAL